MANPQSPILRGVWRFLARLDLAAILILAVLLVAALGSCFPQLSSAVAADPERFARWATGVRSRYGALADFLAASGAFSTSNSAIFLVPLALLATVTFVCTLNRWQSVWRRAFHQQVHCSDLALDTAPYKAGLTTPPVADLPKVVRESLERRGFRVRKEDVGDFFYLRGDRNGRTPLATLVTHLAVLLLLLGTVLSSGYGWREEITIGPGETVEVGHGSGLAVRNDGFTVVRYPNGSAADYEAEITVAERSRKNLHGLVRINEPLTWRSIGFHLRGYAGIEGCLLYTSPSPRDRQRSRMPSSA